MIYLLDLSFLTRLNTGFVLTYSFSTYGSSKPIGYKFPVESKPLSIIKKYLLGDTVCVEIKIVKKFINP